MLSGREAVRTAVKHVSREGGLDTVTTGLSRESAQNQNAVNMSVKVSQQPGIVQNLDLGDGKKRTGVAAQAGGPLLRHDHNAIGFESPNKLTGGAPLLALFEKWAATLLTPLWFWF
jgi:hypothetical protein